MAVQVVTIIPTAAPVLVIISGIVPTKFNVWPVLSFLASVGVAQIINVICA